nr:MAG TPA: hypothetical protein [Caudoviricetes sp.]
MLLSNVRVALPVQWKPRLSIAFLRPVTPLVTMKQGMSPLLMASGR